jgi:hypothetical protein
VSPTLSAEDGNRSSFLNIVFFRIRKWVDNIKMDLREIGWDGVDWIDVAEYRDQWWALLSTVMNLQVP